jgi:adenylate cyclase
MGNADDAVIPRSGMRAAAMPAGIRPADMIQPSMAERRDSGNEKLWRSTLLGTNPALRFGRVAFAALPSAPRCEWCASPFKGPFVPLLRVMGHKPFQKNPRYCAFCIDWLLKRKGGAEVEMSALFADVRGSTQMAESLGSNKMHDLMDRFYSIGVELLIQGGAIIDRFMGDQVVGFFVPGLAGRDHARRAIETGLELLRATGNVAGQTALVPVGAGVQTGKAFIGTVGRRDLVLELAAAGEDVHVAARFASNAGAGELLCSEDAFRASHLDLAAEQRDLDLKGVSATIRARVLRPA